MKKSVMLVLVLAVVGAVLLSLGGCSLSTSTADIRLENNASSDAFCDLDGATYTVSDGTTRTVSLEWDGLGDETYTVDVYSIGGYEFSETFTLSNGDVGLLQIFDAP